MKKNNQVKLIESIESLCYMVAVIDGLSEAEAFELEYIQGRIRMFLNAKPSVQEYEKSGDLEKAVAKLKEPLIVEHIITFGMASHMNIVAKEVMDLIESKPDDIMAEYEVLLKIYASEIEDEYDRKIAMICIEDVYKSDGASSAEKWAHIVLAKEWGISPMKVTKYWNEYVHPVIEESQKNIEF